MRRALATLALATALAALGAAPALAAQTLTVLSAGTGSGTVTSDPAVIVCGSSCQASFDDGRGLLGRPELQGRAKRIANGQPQKAAACTLAPVAVGGLVNHGNTWRASAMRPAMPSRSS